MLNRIEAPGGMHEETLRIMENTENSVILQGPSGSITAPCSAILSLSGKQCYSVYFGVFRPETLKNP